jgi:hypothetical protein
MEEEELYYDEDTLNKVHAVMTENGIAQATEVIGQLQNAGIVFRERVKSDDEG